MNNIALHSYGCTDIGHQRSYNEDYVDMTDSLFVLADGMGGHNAGEIASQLAVENIIKFLDGLDEKEFNEHNDDLQIQQIICDAIMKTNETIYQKSLRNTKLEGMGTTIVLALFQKPQTMHIANVGDSRAYLARKGNLKQLTEDHSVTETMLREGTITQLEAVTHPYRHQLTRSIGTSNSIQSFTYFFNVIAGDKILLCSDGLWNVLSDEEIRDSLQKNISLKKICADLIDKANALQSKDNISSIVIKVSEDK